MNDFTKEDLEIILHNIVVPDEPELRDKAKDLYWKVSDMIDNYCDHEGKTNSNSDVDYILTCSKCDAFKGWV